MSVTTARRDLAAHLLEQLGGEVRVVDRARAVDVGDAPLVQLWLEAVTYGTGEDALYRRAELTVWVVQPGEGDGVDDRLDALLDLVLDAIDTTDHTTWSEVRRATYPPAQPLHAGYLITATREV